MFVYGVCCNDALKNGTAVIHEVGEKEVRDPGQIWQRGFQNIEGYFTLQIANSSLFFTATGADTQQIQGG